MNEYVCCLLFPHPHFEAFQTTLSAPTSGNYRKEHFASSWCCKIEKFEIKNNKCKPCNTDCAFLMISYIVLVFHFYLISVSWARGGQTHPAISSMQWEQPQSRPEHIQWCSLHGDSSSPGPRAEPHPSQEGSCTALSGDFVQSQTCGTYHSRSPSSWSSSKFQDLFHTNECGLCIEAECENETSSYSVMLFLRFADIICVCVRRGKETRMKKKAENVAK